MKTTVHIEHNTSDPNKKIITLCGVSAKSFKDLFTWKMAETKTWYRTPTCETCILMYFNDPEKVLVF